ncbi:MAG TPA: EamA family transporter [Candidatus Lokiarchaeia archaeon]|nr:EamA family transporter [Candidatus Lokiarchaeia archaeon]
MDYVRKCMATVSVLGIVVVLAAAIIWAFASTGYKFALGSAGTEDRDPITSMSVRILFIDILITLIVVISAQLPVIFALPPDRALIYWILGIANGAITLIGDICYFNALRYLDSSRVYPLINIQVIITYPLSFFFFNENIPPLLWISGILMILGVALISKKDAQDRGMEKRSAEAQQRTHLLGIILALCVGISFALQYLALYAQNQITSSLPLPYNGVFVSNFTRLISYGAILWVYMLISRKHLPRWGNPEEKEQLRAYAIMGLIGSVSMGIGDSIYQIGAFANGNPLSITISANSPLFNQLFARTILKEKFRQYFLYGVIAIVIANILVVF